MFQSPHLPTLATHLAWRHFFTSSFDTFLLKLNSEVGSPETYTDLTSISEFPLKVRLKLPWLSHDFP